MTGSPDYIFIFCNSHLGNSSTPEHLPFPKKAKVNQLVLKRIRDAVTGELEAKGLRLSSNPDFMIAMHGATKEKLDIQDWGYSSPVQPIGDDETLACSSIPKAP